MFWSNEYHETYHHDGFHHGCFQETFWGLLTFSILNNPFQLVIPMELFKELICFLRVMLESEDMAHNDIALGALHKIFYISYSVRWSSTTNPSSFMSQDRMDPVNNLLRAWKPERYSRHHLEVLLELVHETMKVSSHLSSLPIIPPFPCSFWILLTIASKKNHQMIHKLLRRKDKRTSLSKRMRDLNTSPLHWNLILTNIFEDWYVTKLFDFTFVLWNSMLRILHKWTIISLSFFKWVPSPTRFLSFFDSLRRGCVRIVSRMIIPSNKLMQLTSNLVKWA